MQYHKIIRKKSNQKIVQTFYILHQRYVSYYISDETYAFLIDGTKIGASCKGVLHHLSCLWDIVFEGNRWLKYHERCLVLSYYQSPPEKMSACSTKLIRERSYHLHGVLSQVKSSS